MDLRLLTITLCLFITASSFGQRASIELPQSRILYYGIENRISVLVENCNCNEVELKSDELHIRKDTSRSYATINCAYMVSPKKKNGLARIEVFSKKKGRSKNISTWEYRVQRVPKPKIDYKGTTYSCYGFTPTPAYALFAKPYDVNYNINAQFTVVEYTAEIHHNFGHKWSKIFTGFRFPDELVRRIEGIKKGDKLIFRNIKISGSGYENEPVKDVIKLRLQ